MKGADNSKRYEVNTGCETIVEFDDLQEARHYARMNAGKVWDRIRWFCIYDYTASDED